MAISQVQKAKSDYAGLGTSQATAYGGNVTKANLLVAFIGINTTAGAVINTITDTLGNTWIPAGGTFGANRNIYVYFAVANATGANTLTVTATASTTIGTAIFEYTGASFLDLTISAFDDTTTPELDYLTPTNANSLLMAHIDTNGVAGVTLNGAWTVQENLQSGGTTFTAVGDQITTSLGRYPITGTLTSGLGQIFGICFAAVARPALAIVQMAIGQSSVAAPTSVTSQPLVNTKGNMLVMAARNGSSVLQTAPTDTAGNTWHAITAVVSGVARVQFWYAYNINAATRNVVTANVASAANSLNFTLWEVQGVPITDPHDTDAGGTSAGGTSSTITTASFTTHQAQEILFGYGTHNGTATGAPPIWTAGAGTTLQVESPTQQVPAGNARFCAATFQILNAVVSGGTRSISYSSTFSSTPTLAIFGIATFKASPSSNQLMLQGLGT